MAEIFDYKAPFNLKKFLGSKGTSGLESIFNYVPDRMKISILQAMHKMHPTQAENFMVKLFNEYVTKLGTGADTNKNYYRWLSEKISPKIAGSGYDIGQRLPLEGPWAGGQDTGYTNIEKIPYEHIKKLKIRLADPNLDAGTRKILNEMLERVIYDASDAGKYNKVLMDQLEKSGVKTITSISPEGVDMGKSILIDKTIPEGDVVDFKTRKILNPKTPFDPNKLMVSKRSLPFLRRKPIPPGQKMTRVPPVPKGIPWSKIGMRLLNNPLTRFVGGVGNVALGGQALLDVYTGSEHTGNMAGSFNKMLGSPVYPRGHERAGDVIHSNVAARAMKGDYTAPDRGDWGPGLHLRTGGIVSLMV